MTPPSEIRRQVVHLSMTGWILLLPWLTPLQACWLAGAAVVLNWVVFPVTGLDRRWFRRPDEGFVNGVKLYPVAVLFALILFPYPAAAAAWAVMGVGDVASNLIGRRYGKPPFLGRADRSLAGTAAFVVCAWPAALGAYLWVASGDFATGAVVVAALVATLAGAAVEYLPLPRTLDDNLPITLAAGAVLWLMA